jgi:hypothetical protein
MVRALDGEQLPAKLIDDIHAGPAPNAESRRMLHVSETSPCGEVQRGRAPGMGSPIMRKGCDHSAAEERVRR